jgi:predicted unusual protein kinase regulating ubiquinone biosynthesis (AarF/ABC1/UbiB family)
VIAYRGMDSLFHEIRTMVLRELDYFEEASSIETIAKNFAGRANIHLPRVYRELTTRRVITTEFIEGIKINDIAALERRGINRRELAKLVIESCCQQVFDHGMYHADPHPGNILVTEGPTIHYIDFGAVGHVSPRMRNGLVMVLQGALRRDTQQIIAGLRDMGFLAPEGDTRVYDRVIEYVYGRFQQEIQIESFNLRDIRFDPQKSFEDIADLRSMNIALADITRSFHVPREWILLERTILLVMGLCTELEPNLNPTQIVRPYVEQFVFGKEGDWSQLMIESSREVLVTALALPAEIKRFLAMTQHGELELRIADYADVAKLQYSGSQQLVFALLTVGSGAAALVFYSRTEPQLTTLASVACTAFFLLLTRSMWRARQLVRSLNRR